jgi:hypothetical protein
MKQASREGWGGGPLTCLQQKCGFHPRYNKSLVERKRRPTVSKDADSIGASTKRQGKRQDEPPGCHEGRILISISHEHTN